MNDATVLELTELCHALADERLTDRERERLNRLLAGSEEARAFYVRYAALQASLCGYAAELQSEAPAPPAADSSTIRRHPLAWSAGLAALAAALATALFLARAARVEDEPTVAWLTGSRDAQWSDAAGPLPGDPLARGQQLELRSGLAEITFDSGARVVLEGPAALDLESAWTAALRSGAATATTPAEAAGFRVASPAVSVTSLGGEVRIDAESADRAQVVSLEGAAEAVTPGGKDKFVLRGKQARRYTAGQPAKMVALDERSTRAGNRAGLDRKGRPLKIAQWSRLSAAERKAARPRTAAAWVRLPADAALGAPGDLTGPSHRRFPNLRVTWNILPERGPLGALRVEHAGEALVGRTSLRDGKWHHVAVMFVAGKKADRFEVKQYVDGRLDGAGRFSRRSLETTYDPAAWVQLGAPGELEELTVADRPMTPDELRSLIEARTPAGA